MSERNRPLEYEVSYSLAVEAGPRVFLHKSKVKALKHARLVSAEFPAVKVRVYRRENVGSDYYGAIVTTNRIATYVAGKGSHYHV